MLLGRVVGLRRSVADRGRRLAIAALLICLPCVDIASARAMQLFLIGMQVMIIGLNFVFWAMLPNTIEYGEQATGLHVEGAVFGVAALLQRIAIGIATAILGWGFASAGYVANVRQSAETLAACGRRWCSCRCCSWRCPASRCCSIRWAGTAGPAELRSALRRSARTCRERLPLRPTVRSRRRSAGLDHRPVVQAVEGRSAGAEREAHDLATGPAQARSCETPSARGPGG